MQSSSINDFESAKIVTVERDYSNGLTPQFDTDLPSGLKGRLSQDEFSDVVGHMNEILWESEQVTCGTVCENIIAYMTCFLSLLCCKTRAQKKYKELEEYIDSVNLRFDAARVEFVSPLVNGLLRIDIIVRPSLMESGVSSLDEKRSDAEKDDDKKKQKQEEEALVKEVDELPAGPSGSESESTSSLSEEVTDSSLLLSKD